MGMLQRQWCRRRKQIAIYFIAVLIAYVGGLAVDAAIYLGDDANGMIPLGTLFVMFMLFMVHLIAGSLYLTMEFELAISMSVTRRHFVREYVSFAFLEMVCYYLMICLMFYLERMIWHNIVGIPLAEELADVLDAIYLYMALGMMGLIAIELLAAALILRFGMKIFWVLWILIMLPNFSKYTAIKFPEEMLTQSGAGMFFSQLGRPGICGMILCAELLIFFFAYRLFKRQQIA